MAEGTRLRLKRVAWLVFQFQPVVPDSYWTHPWCCAGNYLQGKILWIAPFGDLFVRLLKMIMMPIILSTLIVGASSISPATLGKVGLRIVILYLITSAVAVIIGLLMGTIFRPSAAVEALTIAGVAGRRTCAETLCSAARNYSDKFCSGRGQ